MFVDIAPKELLSESLRDAEAPKQMEVTAVAPKDNMSLSVFLSIEVQQSTTLQVCDDCL
jgi:hypothetical protein